MKLRAGIGGILLLSLIIGCSSEKKSSVVSERIVIPDLADYMPQKIKFLVPADRVSDPLFGPQKRFRPVGPKDLPVLIEKTAPLDGEFRFLPDYSMSNWKELRADSPSGWAPAGSVWQHFRLPDGRRWEGYFHGQEFAPRFVGERVSGSSLSDYEWKIEFLRRRVKIHSKVQVEGKAALRERVYLDQPDVAPKRLVLRFKLQGDK